MSETKPPEGWDSWLSVWEKMDSDEFRQWQLEDDNAVSGWNEVEDFARAELAQLRAKAAAYDEIMRRAPSIGCIGPGEMEIPT